ncbi:HdeD family acid-resistance protein [Alsobacter sp. R-9]
MAEAAKTGALIETDPPTASRSRGLRFLVIGLALLLLGGIAIALPDASTTATGTILGTVVTIGGVVVVVQALRDTHWRGFTWQLLFGSAEVVGGILIVLNPLKGAAAIALLVVIVMVAQAVTQVGLALKIRPARGWWWLLVASAVTVLIALGLLLRFPYDLVDSPGEMAGIAMVFAGTAFLLIGAGWLRLHAEAAS